MKFSATIVAVAVLASQAAAVPHPDAKPHIRGGQIGFCGLPGSPCLKVKRAAHAIADAMAEARIRGGQIGFCGLPGSPCLKARDQIEDIAATAEDAYTSVFVKEAEAEADPEAKKNHKVGGWDGIVARDAEPKIRGGQIGFCGLPGSPCLKSRDAIAEAKIRGGQIGFCGLPGSPCLRLRDAVADAEAKHHHIKGGEIGFCGPPGAPCLKARDAEAEARIRGGQMGFCGLPGSPCLKRRDAVAEAKKHHHIKGGEIGFCGLPGAPCLKARDGKTITDLVKNADPEFLRGECFREGSECHTLLKIHKAMQEVKRDAKAVEKVTGDEKAAHCGEKGADCDFFAKAHAYAQKFKPEAAKKEEKECWGPEGACTIAQRDFDELDATVSDAVASLNE